MNIAKHMEAVFVAAIAIVAATSFATAAVPAPQKASAVAALVSPVASQMQVVTIVGKRLSTAEKLQLAE
jgi:hypothetical protein